jgi:hypothetical protein
LEAALQELKTFDTHLKIVLMHHPLHFLSWFECQHIEAALIDDVDIVLSGHVHAAGIKNVQMSNGRNLLCSAGATYQTRDWPNTAYYATFEGSQVRIFPICYVDRSREMWALDTGLAPAPPFELSYPVPREPDFRTFRLPGLRRSEVVASLAALAEAQEAPDEPELSKRAIAVKGNRNTTANRGPKR